MAWYNPISWFQSSPGPVYRGLIKGGLDFAIQQGMDRTNREKEAREKRIAEGIRQPSYDVFLENCAKAKEHDPDSWDVPDDKLEHLYYYRYGIEIFYWEAIDDGKDPEEAMKIANEKYMPKLQEFAN